MPLFVLDGSLSFPPVELAEPDGLLAIGGDLSLARLQAAYTQGIFPWYDEAPILWWCPDPRFVLFPQELRISKSMKQVLQNNIFQFTVNQAFEQVIEQCEQTKRAGQDGTWITSDMKSAYIELHRQGLAHSAEAWYNGQLAGGLYGVKLRNVFCGESMFSHQSNASKYAFIRYTQLLQQQGIALIDCQVHTPHLESLGARMIPRADFMKYLRS
jgi:leucyl/phenylalanyl-tRNA---protein transferase